MAFSVPAVPVYGAQAANFTLTPFPSSLTINAGSSAASTVLVSSVSGFNGTVLLSSVVSPPGPVATLSRSSVSLPPFGNASAILTVSTTTSTTPRSYNVTVTGKSGSLSHSVIVRVAVNPAPSPDFMLSANPPFLITMPGIPANSTILLIPLNGFSGAVSLRAAPSQGLTVLLSPTTITATTFANLSLFASIPGNYTVDVIGTSGSLVHTVTVHVTVRSLAASDFAITANPSAITVSPLTPASSTIIVSSLNGFADKVFLTVVTPPPPGFSVSISPTVLLLSPNGTGQATMTVSSLFNATITSFDLRVFGASGVLSHFTTVHVSATLAFPPDYSINAPSFLSMDQGSIISVTVIVSSIRNFTGTVSLTPDIFPHFPNAPTSTLTPNQVAVSPFSSGFSTLTIATTSSTPTGPYNYTIAGSASFAGGLLNHLFVGQLLVNPPPKPDFNINAYPTALFFQAGTFATSQVQVYSIGPSNGNFTVILTAQVQPVNGLTAAFNPSLVTVSQFVPGSSTLTVNTLTTTPAGNYTVTIVGTSNGFTHSLPISLQVIAPPSLKLTPSSGIVGTKVLVQGSGFPVQFGQTEIFISFDNDQFMGFVFTSTRAFNFSFDIPPTQAGPHTIKASEPAFFSNLSSFTATATFQVLPTPNQTNLSASLDIGTIYFPGDQATAFLLINQNGQPVSPSDLQLTIRLIQPDGSNQTLKAARTAVGVYSVAITIPNSKSLGTYALIANAHSSSFGDSSALRSFEVKPTWISANASGITTGVALVGLTGTLGLIWRKGYFRKGRNEQAFP